MTDDNEKWMNAGYIQAMFNDAIEAVAKLTETKLMDAPTHNAVLPMLDDMTNTLYSMKNNVLAAMLLGDKTPMKVWKEEKE